VKIAPNALKCSKVTYGIYRTYGKLRNISKNTQELWEKHCKIIYSRNKWIVAKKKFKEIKKSKTQTTMKEMNK